MDRIDLFRRLDLENDILAAIDNCTERGESVCCIDQVREFIGSIDPIKAEASIYQKMKVVTELEKIADLCQQAPDSFCRARLFISNAMQ